LIGVTILNKEGWSVIVFSAIVIAGEKLGGSGNGSAVSVAKAEHGLAVNSLSQIRLRENFGRDSHRSNWLFFLGRCAVGAFV
jgi:hypothetical protein